jgi:hypothetical protein
MPADDGFQLMFRHVRAFHHDFLPHHDGRGRSQVQFEVFVRLVLGNGFGSNFDIKGIFLAQPGQHLLEMLSGLAVGLVIETSDFEHGILLFSTFFPTKLLKIFS